MITAELKTESGEKITAECKQHYLWWQQKGLQFTASGYGKKIPTPYMIKVRGRWKRVYCCIYSNIGWEYIVCNGKKLTINRP